MGGEVKRAGGTADADVDLKMAAAGNVGKKITGRKGKKGKAAHKELTPTTCKKVQRADEEQGGKGTRHEENGKEDVVEKQEKSASYENEGDTEQNAANENDGVEIDAGLEGKKGEVAENVDIAAIGSGGVPSAGGEDEDGERFAKLVGVGEGWEDGDDEGAMETVAVGLLPGQVFSDARNDEAGLERKLEEIGIFCGEEALPFRQSLAVTMSLKEKLGDKLAVDDLKRERRFAELARDAVHEGLERLRAENVKFRRPGDYFAQMVKTDAHMVKVKDKLLYEKGRIEGAERRRNNRDIAKNRKKVRATQMEKEQEKKRKAREEIEALSRLRKQRLKDREEVGVEGEDDGDEFPIDLLEVEQLDDENRFRPEKEIAEGKRKGWSGKKEVGGARGSRKTGKGKDVANGPSGGRVQKRKQGPRGKKKRLGKSRRAASKSRVG